MKKFEQIMKKPPFVLMLVADHTKGSPGKQGFKMVVSADGDSIGTVGGGVMEHKLQRQACEMLKAQTAQPLLLSQVHNREAAENRSGMICAGSQTIILAPSYKPLTPSGRLLLTKTGIFFSDEKKEAPLFFDPKEWRYEENIATQNFFYIAGGGHVGLALSRVMATLDFHVTVFDHRDHLKMMQENTYAHNKVVIPFDRIGEYIQESANSYAAVVSTNFKTDEMALQQLLNKNLAYLGIMGSPTKIDHLFKQLLNKGYTQAQLNKLHAPIGLPIQSSTAEEIAVSIAAQVIDVRAKLAEVVLCQ